MRAAALHEFGEPEVLRLTEVPEPQAGPGEVRVRVRAAGVQPFDTGVRRGWAPPSVSLEFPVVPGNEFAGVVDQAGPGFPVGTEVLGYTTLGSYAEHVVAPVGQVVVKPASMSWEIAGGFSGNGQGAHLALTELAVGPGDTLLIHGASGAFGTFSVLLARAWGAKVIGTASEKNHDYLRELGAIPVTYGEGLVDRVRALSEVDAALDGAGPEALRASVELVADKNRIRTMISDEAAEELGVPPLRPSRNSTRLAELVALYEKGELPLRLREVFPIDRAADAHRLVETGHGRGKVVLRIS